MFFFHHEPLGAFFLQIEFFGWRLVMCTEDWLPESIVITHPDTRSFGFWFEDFQFDYYPVEDKFAVEEARREFEARIEAENFDSAIK